MRVLEVDTIRLEVTASGGARLELTDDQVEALRRQLAVDAPDVTGPELLDAAAVARRLGVSRSYVYEHAAELGGVQIGATGAGKKPRWRFDPARLTAPSKSETTATPPASKARRRPRTRTSGSSGFELLPIRGHRS